MWTRGTINGFEYEVKHFEIDSVWGINEGRISKLEIKKDGKIAASYDRGWDIEPTTTETKETFDKILKQYN